MHPYFNKLSFIALAALAAVLAPAHAATSKATASIDNFRYELVDLNLADGITPSITFTSHMMINAIYADGTQQSSGLGSPMWIGNAFGSAEGTRTDTSLRSTAKINHLPTPDNANHAFTNEFSHWASFTLSPNTQLIFTGVGTIAQELAGPVSYSKSYIRMHAYLSDGYTYDRFTKEYESNTGSFSMNLYGSVSSNEQAIDGGFHLMTGAVLTRTSPVPEPSTYGMLLAGTFMVGAMARRQRRAVARPAA
ncbi:MAG TPA: PEP-CTERM sorting domain-containing protein [Telluria sp.]|jgi:hypothetical protein